MDDNLFNENLDYSAQTNFSKNAKYAAEAQWHSWLIFP